ncbi:ABC transporter permease [Mesorhizobium sp. B3-1-6]|uniref:ABC transporter permease n=1 Tax=Mesorhizobium sp. B3-1-6 TaxID=2589895 RepID=UPI00112B8F2B|nr:ABC transporter permease [Mesorhizobium sp. B3-1-6]TPI41342.1 ABC transporter permease [Mesorhizobium sp. B3-1-6]
MSHKDVASAADIPSTTVRRGAVPARFGFLRGLSLAGLLLVMWAALSVTTDTFLTHTNFVNLARQASIWSIIAIGQTFVIITGGIDLSVGAVIGFTGVVVAMLMQAGLPIWLSIALTLLVGAAIGTFHAFGVLRLGLPPFIMTLATLTSVRGIGFIMTNGAPLSGFPDPFTDFSVGSFLGIPLLFWVVIAVAIPAYLLLHHTSYGRYIFATGSNREAARLSGVNVTATIYLVYIISSTLAALAGVLTASRIGVAIAGTGEGWELQSIAASVIGGTSLFGAIGTAYGPLLGAMLISTINNGANLVNINSFWQQVITGGLIILIVFIDQSRRKGR